MDHVGVVIQQVQRRKFVVLQLLADINARQIPGHIRGDVIAMLDGEIIRLGLWFRRRLRLNYRRNRLRFRKYRLLRFRFFLYRIFRFRNRFRLLPVFRTGLIFPEEIECLLVLLLSGFFIRSGDTLTDIDKPGREPPADEECPYDAENHQYEEGDDAADHGLHPFDALKSAFTAETASQRVLQPCPQREIGQHERHQHRCHDGQDQ